MDFGLLEFYAERPARLPNLKEALHAPAKWAEEPWPPDWRERLEAVEKRLESHPEGEGMIDLLRLNLLALLLLRPAALPGAAAGHIARPEVLAAVLGPGFDADRLLAGRWIGFPVTLALCGRGCVRYFLTGAIPAEACGESCLPPWVEGVFDAPAREAAVAALSRCESRAVLPAGSTPFLIPILAPGNAVRIEGRSLGLPAWLALQCLLTGERWPEGLAATGEIGADGALQRVGHLDEKLAAARSEGFRALLYPAENGAAEGGGGIEAIPARTVGEAWSLARLYSPGRCREIILLSAMMDDPRAFVDNMARVDPRWVERRCLECTNRSALEAVFEKTDLLRVFARNLGNLAADWRLDEARVFIGLIGDRQIEAAAQTSPAAALALFTAALKVCNHRGEIAEAGRWAAAGERVLAAARRADLEVCADFVNNRLVLRHNRYRFEPDPGPEVSELLALLEKRRRLACEGGCEVDVKLGELHGTLSQNYGFCGPDYINPCLRHAMLAMDAFGKGAVEEFIPEMLRLPAYMFYAYLDAGRRDKALDALGAFTGAPGWDELLAKVRDESLSQWHHAAVARLLAESPGEAAAEVYLSLVREAAPRMIREEHPWQLWLFNLGRIAMNLRMPSSALRFFAESLRLCRLAKLGPTVRLMALLPLSGMRLLDCLPDDLEEIDGEIRRASEALGAARFDALLAAPLKRALEPVWWRPEAFFPFSYR
jgi:hypothetical protein